MRKLMLTSKGSYINPVDKPCWSTCLSCRRCSNKGSRDACASCSGRYDPDGQRHPDLDDYCRCKDGTLQWVTDEGKFLQVKIPHDPFKGTIQREGNSRDEQDWNSYLNDTRERLDNETYDPVQIPGVGSATDWYNSQKEGR